MNNSFFELFVTFKIKNFFMYLLQRFENRTFTTTMYRKGLISSQQDTNHKRTSMKYLLVDVIILYTSFDAELFYNSYHDYKFTNFFYYTFH